ncbi:CsbD family protein [Streptomyces tubercidicus]|uniref:CsbD family protein n=1 Tax=Streptomyces tubercidicus TaxID=47759 RepID=UPI002E0E46D6|nr:CsbD family protein [Streptomyces tubercidicus]WSX19258.1 CsbD family protein [Streptomyces tubercidicus]
MSIAKKTRNISHIVEGKAKERTGRALGNKSLQRRGRAEQAMGKMKQAVEKGRDSFKH